MQQMENRSSNKVQEMQDPFPGGFTNKKNANLKLLISMPFRFPPALSSHKIVHTTGRAVFSFTISQNHVDNGDHGTTAGKIMITIRLGDRGPEIDQVQHCNTITQGQEERIPKTTSVVGKTKSRAF